jgi:hypothetical protein
LEILAKPAAGILAGGARRRKLMPLAQEDATRILRFCLAGDGTGTAFREDHLCVVKIVRSGVAAAESFEGGTFEEALRRAAAASVLKSSCLERQIAFLARALPSVEVAPELEVVAAAVRSRLFLAMTAAVSALVHETQRERGASSLYVSSGGRLFEAELREQWRVTDQRQAEMRNVLERNRGGLPHDLGERLERGEALLASVLAERPRVEALDAAVGDVIERYTAINAELLAVLDGLAMRAVEARLRPTALAWMALLHAKEKTGLERAQLSSAFTRDRYADGQYASVLSLVAARQSYLHVFSVAAPRSAEELLRKTLSSPVEQEFVEMERVALMKKDGGFGIDPAAWFLTISRKMDLYGCVETAVRASMACGAG